jgi:hypothetical protein
VSLVEEIETSLEEIEQSDFLDGLVRKAFRMFLSIAFCLQVSSDSLPVVRRRNSPSNTFRYSSGKVITAQEPN